MSPPVVVKVGAVTAVGMDARQTGFMMRAGLPAMTEAPLADAAGAPITMALVPTLDPALVGAERLEALARDPLLEAADPIRDLVTEVLLAIDEGCDDALLVARRLESLVLRAMPHARVTVEPRGEAAPGHFLPRALRALESRQVDAIMLGGVHSDYDPRAITRLEAGGRLFSRSKLDARIPGEAAAFVAMMRPADASRHRLPVLARVVGVGAAVERARPDNDDAAFEAFGMTAAVREATAGLAAEGRTAGWFLTDLTSEMRRLYEWEAVFVRAQNVLGRPYIIESPAQRVGYLGAAALPLFMSLAATAWEHGYAPAPLALAIAGNDGGDRAALVLEQG